MDDLNIYKVAVASTDGETVNQHFGKAEKFFVYKVDDEEGYDLLEERKVKPICLDGSHLVSEMEKGVKRFEDCRYVIAAKIGPGAGLQLNAKGIISMELPGSIDDAMVKVWKYNRIQGLFN